MSDAERPNPGPEGPTGNGYGDPEQVHPRFLVPTPRERDLGERVSDDAAPAQRGGPLRRPPMEAFRAYARDLDPRTFGGPAFPLLVLSLGGLITRWDNIALEVLLPEIRGDFGFSIQFLITLSALLLIVSQVLAPVLGYVADRVPRIWMMRIGGIFSNIASVVQGAAPGAPQLVGGRLMSGAADAVAWPALFPIMADYFPARSRARVFAFLGLMTGIGGLVGPPLVGTVAQNWSWRHAVIGFGVLSTLVTFLLFFVKEPKRGYQERLEITGDEEVAEREQEPVSWAESWRAARSITTLRRLWYATPPLYVAGTVMGTFLGLYWAAEFGLGPQARGFIGTGGSLLSLLALPFAAAVADRLLAHKPGRIMTILGVLMFANAASVLVLVLSGSLWLSILATLPLAFLGSLVGPAQGALMSLVVPPRVRGLGMTTIAPWNLVGVALVLGVVAPLMGDWGIRQGLVIVMPLYLAGAVILASAALGVDRDIRAAKAASMADEEARRARRGGGNKMLICRDVDVTYDGTQVLFNVDFDVAEGEIVALLGTNGAGKSTLLRAIAGIQEASNGAVFLDGQDITHAPPHENARRGVVMVPGGRAIFPTLTVEENLRTAAWMYRGDEAYVRERTAEVLELFPVLRERLHQHAGTLSGGEQQMVALGQAFLMRPRLLMIDELSLGLAPQIVEQLLATLREIHAQGTTVVIVEQSLNVAVTVADRAAFMEKGEIRFDGSTAELMRRPELVRAVFMGGAIGGSAPALRATGPARQERDGADRERVLTVRDIEVRYGGVRAVDGASLDVGAGEIVGIIGPNGAGKTTLFDVISGFVAPQAGEVLLEATDVVDLSPDARARMGLGRSFQNTRLFPALTVRENIAVALERHLATRNPAAAALWLPKARRSERRAARRVDGLIELLGLEAYADKFVDELSTGTRRAVDIACVMASQPRVLLLDEPSSGLAQAETEELGPVLVRLSKDTGAGLLVIEHDLPLITSISNRLVAMELGKVIASGPPADVVRDDRVVASYLSASESVVGRSDRGGLAEMLGIQGGSGGRERAERSSSAGRSSGMGETGARSRAEAPRSKQTGQARTKETKRDEDDQPKGG